MIIVWGRSLVDFLPDNWANFDVCLNGNHGARRQLKLRACLFGSKNLQLLCSLQSKTWSEQRVTLKKHLWGFPCLKQECVVISEAKRLWPPTMDVSTASPSAASAVWPPAVGPNSLSGNQEMLHARFPPPPVHLGLHPRMGPAPQRLPIRPFFVREIYKNGFLKRLAPNEKKSSALSKLMRSDRYWVVFSVHDLGAEQVSLYSF